MPERTTKSTTDKHRKKGGAHYSKEFKDYYLSTWKFYAKPKYTNQKDWDTDVSFFLNAVVDGAILKFEDEMKLHGYPDKKRLRSNLYQSLHRWIIKFNPEYKKYASHTTVVIDELVEESTEKEVVTTQNITPYDKLMQYEDAIEDVSNQEYTQTKIDDAYYHTSGDVVNVNTALDFPKVVSLKNEAEPLRSYCVSILYSISKSGIVFKWSRFECDVDATDEIDARSKLYKSLWIKTGNPEDTITKRHSEYIRER